MHTVTQTIHQVELKNREWNSPRGSPTPKHRRPSPVHGSPAPKHYGPSPAQWGPMADHETMSIEAQGHLPDNFHDASLYQIHRRWTAPQGSPTPKHRRPKPVHSGSMGHPKPTPMEPEGRVPDSFLDGTSSAFVYRRWKSPRGSPSHKPTKSHHEPLSTYSATCASGSTDTTSSALLIADCTSIAPGVTDTPATRNDKTGHLTRSTCGTTDATVAECPWLCTQGDGGLFNGCYDRNSTGIEPLDEFPPRLCARCPPPCKQTSSSSLSTTSTMTSSTLSSPSATRASSPTCIHGTPGLTVDPSGPAHNESGTLFRNSCGETKATVAECPWLCYIQGGVQVCSNYNATEPWSQRIFICHQCLPPCDQPLNSSLPTKDSFLPTTSTTTTSLAHSTLPPTSCLLPTKDKVLSTGTTTTSIPPSTLPPTCTSIAPGTPESPAFQNHDFPDGLLYRWSCGTTNATVAECPWLCSNGGAVPICNDVNVSGARGLYPVYCTQCLPPCIQTSSSFDQSSSTSASKSINAASRNTVNAASTSIACTTLVPFVGTIPSTKDNATGALLRFECGLSFRLAYECPYLCGYDVGENLGECYDQDHSASAPKEKDIEYKCTHCFYPSRKVAAPSASDKSNCTAIDPYNPPCPPGVRFDDGIRYQTACAAKAIEIKDCPYLCTAVDKPDQYHCENENLDGSIFKPTGTTQVCVQCLPEC